MKLRPMPLERYILPFALFLLIAGRPATGNAETVARGAVVKGTSELDVPRFASLGAKRVFMRTGPGQQYPISWLYKRPGLPVIVVAEFDVWRQIKDPDGATGWVHGNLLSGRRMGYVTGQLRLLRKNPAPGAPAVLKAEPGVLGRIRKCDGSWCEMTVLGYRGWMRQDEIWGAFTGERIE